VVLAPLVFAVLVATPEHVGDGRLHVQLLDVGHGDAVVAVSPTGRLALIDGGPADASAHLRTKLGELIKAPKGHKGARAIEVVVVTQAAAEHFGALGALLRESPPKTLVIPRDGPAALESLASDLKEKGTVVTEAQDVALSVDLGGDSSVEVLGAGGALAARLSYGQTAIWVMGDSPQLEPKVETSANAAATVLMATGHGRGDASTGALVKMVHPDAVVVSVGAGNGAGLPDRAALERLGADGAHVFRTDLDGDLTGESDGTHLTLTPSRAMAGVANETFSFPAAAPKPVVPRKGKR
jgi:competence protein ComEC